MKLKHPTLIRFAALGGAAAAGLLRRTIDWRAVYADPTVDPAHPRHAGRYLFLCWHEYLLAAAVLHGSRKMLALASGHTDGELVSRAMQHLGWTMARGSTSRGGTAALLRLLRDDARHLSITPDGPRGPRRTMAPGALFLASRLGLPVVCMGYGYDRAWRMRSWDRFAVPRPFARGRVVFGPPLTVPPGLDRDGLDRYRLWFEKLLNWLTDEAETWAGSGERLPGAVPVRAGHSPHALFREPEPTAPPLPADLATEWDALARTHRAAA